MQEAQERAYILQGTGLIDPGSFVLQEFPFPLFPLPSFLNNERRLLIAISLQRKQVVCSHILYYGRSFSASPSLFSVCEQPAFVRCFLLLVPGTLSQQMFSFSFLISPPFPPPTPTLTLLSICQSGKESLLQNVYKQKFQHIMFKIVCVL